MPPKKRQDRDDAQSFDITQDDRAKRQKFSFVEMELPPAQPRPGGKPVAQSNSNHSPPAGTSTPHITSSGAKSAAASRRPFTKQDQPRSDSTSQQSAWTNQHSSRDLSTQDHALDTWNERPSDPELPLHHKKILEDMTANMSKKFQSTQSSSKVVGIIDYTTFGREETTLIGFSGRDTKFSRHDPGGFFHSKMGENISKWSSEDKARRYRYIPDISLDAQKIIANLKKKNNALPKRFCAEDKLGSEILKLKTLAGDNGQERIAPSTPLAANYYEISPRGTYKRVYSCENCNKTRKEYSNMENPLTKTPPRSIPTPPTQSTNLSRFGVTPGPGGKQVAQSNSGNGSTAGTPPLTISKVVSPPRGPTQSSRTSSGAKSLNSMPEVSTSSSTKQDQPRSDSTSWQSAGDKLHTSKFGVKTKEQLLNASAPRAVSTSDTSASGAVSTSRARAVYTSPFPVGNSTSPPSSHLNQDSPHEPGTKPGCSFSR